MGCQCNNNRNYPCGEASLALDLLSGIRLGMSDLGNPTFIWQGASYPCLPSVSEFQRELGDGGFRMDKLFTATIPLQDNVGNLTFPGNIMPDTQQLVYYMGDRFRIIMKKIHPTSAYIRIVAQSDTRGI